VLSHDDAFDSDTYPESCLYRGMYLVPATLRARTQHYITLYNGIFWLSTHVCFVVIWVARVVPCFSLFFEKEASQKVILV